MIQANELRIGNFYQSLKFGIPVTLDISDLSQLDHDRDGAELDSETIGRMFAPIPLTGKWLKNFGYEKSTAWYRKDKHAINPLLNNLYEFKNIPIIEVEYVHQLQNLYFALTGTELQITKP